MLKRFERHKVRVRDNWSEPFKTVAVEAIIDIDMESLIEQLVRRAANAKTQRATGMNGRIKVRVKRVQP